jgi:hypothetical protein
MPIRTTEKRTLTIGSSEDRLQITPGKPIIIASEKLIVESIYSCVSLVTDSAFHFAALSDGSYLFYPDPLDSDNCVRLSKFAFAALKQTMEKISEDYPSGITSVDNFALFINHKNN